MGSSENLATIDSWAFRPTLPDSWFADYIARDAETLTRALQKSFSGSDDVVPPFHSLLMPDSAASGAPPTTPTVSGLSGGSDHESGKKRRAETAVGATGKVSKRRSRKSKRSQTTFITADAANFRQMVQQVTGVRFGGSHVSMAPVLKPEPQRLNGVAGGGARFPVGCLPTLDTSAFLLDHHQQQVVGPNSSGTMTGISGPGPLSFGPSGGVVDGSSLATPGGLDCFDTFSSFPTLESWKVMWELRWDSPQFFSFLLGPIWVLERSSYGGS